MPPDHQHTLSDDLRLDMRNFAQWLVHAEKKSVSTAGSYAALCSAPLHAKVPLDDNEAFLAFIESYSLTTHNMRRTAWNALRRFLGVKAGGQSASVRWYLADFALGGVDGHLTAFLEWLTEGPEKMQPRTAYRYRATAQRILERLEGHYDDVDYIKWVIDVEDYFSDDAWTYTFELLIDWAKQDPGIDFADPFPLTRKAVDRSVFIGPLQPVEPIETKKTTFEQRVEEERFNIRAKRARLVELGMDPDKIDYRTVFPVSQHFLDLEKSMARYVTDEVRKKRAEHDKVRAAACIAEGIEPPNPDPAS